MSQELRPAGELERYAWLPLPILVSCAILALLFDSSASYSSHILLYLANFLFIGVIPLLVALLATWSFAAGGAISLLFLATGMFTLGYVGTVSTYLTASLDFNLRAAVLTPAILLAGFWHILSVFSSMFRITFKGRLGQRLLLLLLAYLVAAGGVVAVTIIVEQGRMPAFFIDNHPTPLRQTVLIASVCEFFIAALLYRVLYRRLKECFLHWYSLALFTYGLGLLIVCFTPLVDSIVMWIGRATQYLGCMYILIGVIYLTRDVRQKGIPLHWRLSTPFHIVQFDFQPLTDRADDAVLFLDETGRVMYANARATGLFGRSFEETRGVRLQELVVSTTSSSIVQEELESLFKHKGRFVAGRILDMELCGKNGNIFPARITFLADSSDAASILVAIIKDVSAEKQAEQSLRESEEKFRRLAENTNDIVYSLTASGRVNYVGPQIQRYGYKPEEVIGTSIWDFVWPGDRQRAQAHWKAAFARSSDTALEFRMSDQNGRVYWFEDRGSAVFDAAGHPLNLTGVLRDITERREAEEALREAHEQLEQRVVERTEELARANEALRVDVAKRLQIEEDLRQLNQDLEQRVAARTEEVGAHSAQLRKLALELSQAEQRERRRLAQVLHDHLQQLLMAAKMNLFAVISRNSDPPWAPLRELETVLNDSVSASRSLTVELSPPVLYELGLAAALNQLAQQMLDKYSLRVHLVVEAVEPRDDDLRVFFYQAARELLFNITKHANVGEAEVRLRREQQDLVLEVEDKGSGFDPATLRQPNDGGFGLFSLRERAELLGGALQVKSAPGDGTVMSLRTPAYSSERPLQSGQTSEREEAVILERIEYSGANEPALSEPVRVLVADDHQIFREGLVSLIDLEIDLDVVGQAADGEAAVLAALQLRPDVIIMDVNMPQLSGVEATRRIKATLPEIYIIGLSMYEEDEMASAMKAAGADWYLNKGGPSEALLNAIRNAGAISASIQL